VCSAPVHSLTSPFFHSWSPSHWRASPHSTPPRKLLPTSCSSTPLAPISGIGLETSLQFASEGGLILLTDINETAVAQAAELVNKQFPSADAEGIKCDVSKEADVKAAIDRAVEKWGRLDVLVSRRIT
jgi:hypothetical protein